MFSLPPSGKRFCRIRTRTARFCNRFIHGAIWSLKIRVYIGAILVSKKQMWQEGGGGVLELLAHFLLIIIHYPLIILRFEIKCDRDLQNTLIFFYWIWPKMETVYRGQARKLFLHSLLWDQKSYCNHSYCIWWQRSALASFFQASSCVLSGLWLDVKQACSYTAKRPFSAQLAEGPATAQAELPTNSFQSHFLTLPSSGSTQVQHVCEPVQVLCRYCKSHSHTGPFSRLISSL